MSTHQDMGRRKAATQINAQHRLAQLHSNGHYVNIVADPTSATLTITRREGYASHVTITPEQLPEAVKNGAPFITYPQNVLIAHAIIAIADWSESVDQRGTGACIGCGNRNAVTANYNHKEDRYDWICPDCMYGTAA